MLLRARLVPARAGADTQAVIHIPLSQLRQLPGAQALEDAWIRARAGEDGYLSGTDAETAACDAQTVPVVTGVTDPDVIDKMILPARTAAEADLGAAASEALVCQFHHDVCIHRRGWRLILHPDGTTEARSPDGRRSSDPTRHRHHKPREAGMTSVPAVRETQLASVADWTRVSNMSKSTSCAAGTAQP